MAAGCFTLLMQGSVFVEFTEKLTADKFLALEEIKFKDVPLLKESKWVKCSVHTAAVFIGCL